MDENNNPIKKCHLSGNSPHAILGRLEQTSPPKDADSDWSVTENEQPEIKSYQTLSAVKYDDAPPHVLQAVKNIRPEPESGEFCSVTILDETSGHISTTMCQGDFNSPSSQTLPTDYSLNQLKHFENLDDSLENTSDEDEMLSTDDCSFTCGVSSKSNSSSNNSNNSNNNNNNNNCTAAITHQSNNTVPRFSLNQQSLNGGHVCSVKPQQTSSFRKRQMGESPFFHNHSCETKKSRYDNEAETHQKIPGRPFGPRVRSNSMMPMQFIKANGWQQCFTGSSNKCNSHPNPHASNFEALQQQPGLSQTLMVPQTNFSHSVGNLSEQVPGKNQSIEQCLESVSVKWNENEGAQCNARTEEQQVNETEVSNNIEIRNAPFPMTRRYIMLQQPANHSHTSKCTRTIYGDSGVPIATNTWRQVIAPQHNSKDCSDLSHACPPFSHQSIQFAPRNVPFSYATKSYQGPKKYVGEPQDPSHALVVQGLPPNISPKDIFCLVPGRLGMPNQSKRHEVLVGEILRRVLTPESLNISLLGPILRKAKSKNGSQYLRQRLHQIGVQLPQGRRKTAKCTLFTSLTESEAGQLAEDFAKLCQFEFPAKSLAHKALQGHKADELPCLTREAIENSLRLLEFFMVLMQKPKPLLHHEGSWACPSGIGGTTADGQLYNYEALTHGFGIKTLQSSLLTFRTFLLFLEDAKSEQ